MKKLIPGLILGLATAAASAAPTTATPSMEEMWRIIQEQQAEITRLKAQAASADEEIKETSVKADATASLVEETRRRCVPSPVPTRVMLGVSLCLQMLTVAMVITVLLKLQVSWGAGIGILAAIFSPE